MPARDSAETEAAGDAGAADDADQCRRRTGADAMILGVALDEDDGDEQRERDEHAGDVDDDEAAIAAYRRAVETLQSIRHDVALRYGNPNAHSSFRDVAGAMYFQLADLLLPVSYTHLTLPTICSV